MPEVLGRRAFYTTKRQEPQSAFPNQMESAMKGKMINDTDPFHRILTWRVSVDLSTNSEQLIQLDVCSLLVYVHVCMMYVLSMMYVLDVCNLLYNLIMGDIRTSCCC